MSFRRANKCFSPRRTTLTVTLIMMDDVLIQKLGQLLLFHLTETRNRTGLKPFSQTHSLPPNKNQNKPNKRLLEPKGTAPFWIEAGDGPGSEGLVVSSCRPTSEPSFQTKTVLWAIVTIWALKPNCIQTPSH